MKPIDDDEQRKREPAGNGAQRRRSRPQTERDAVSASAALADPPGDVLASITDAFAAVDREWRFTYVNPRMEELVRPLDHSARTLLGTVMWDAFPDLLGTLAERHYREAMDGKEASRFEFFYPPLDRWFDIRAYPARSGISIYAQDITERKRTEDALHASQARLQLALDAGRMGDWEWNIAAGTVRWSPTLEAIHGLAPGTFPGTFEAYQRDIHPGDREAVIGRIRESVETRSPYRIEYRIVKPDGTVAWIEARGRLTLDERGEPARMIGICMDATARKEAELALRESEAFSRIIIESSRDCIKTLSLDGRVLWMSEAGRRALCIADLEAVLGTPWFDFWHGKDRAAAIAAVQAAAAGGTGQFAGYLPVNGEARWFDVMISPIPGADGRPEKLLAVSRDVTSHRLDTADRTWLTDVLERSLNEIYLFDTRTLRFDYVNQGAIHNLGYTLEALRQMTPLDIKPEYTEASFRAMLQPLLDGTAEQYVFETVHRRADATTYPVEVHLQRVMHGTRPIFLAVILDITARLDTEAALRRSEAELRAMADAMPQLAWVAEPDGNIVWYNRRWYEYTGTTFEQMQGWGWQAVHDPDVLPRVLERWRASLSSGDPFEMEFPLRGADGAFRWFLTRVHPARDEGGHIVRWFGTNTDMDQVQQAREALQEEARVLELLNRTGAMLSSKLDMQTLVQAVTDTGRELSGAQFGAFFYNVTADDGGEFSLYTLSGAPREAFERFGHPRATPIFGPTLRGEAIIRCDDVQRDPRYGQWPPHYGMPPGHLPVRSYLAAPVVSPSGAVMGGLFFGHADAGVFTERTERLIKGVAAQAAIVIDNARLYEAAQKAAAERQRLLESERSARAHAERMSEVKDEFLATVSHELRTPLSAILGWSQVLQRGSQSSADLRKGLEAIERNARAQTQLIDDLLDVSRITSGKVRLDIQPVDPVSFVEAALETVRPAAEAKAIRIEKIIDPGAGPVHGDPNRLQQIVWNLLSNAIKFTPRNGKVQVTVMRVESHAALHVTDTGIGVAPEFLPHVFTRFSQGDPATTRKYGGLGLGLSIVKHLAEMHGGTVAAASEGEGRGATFSVTLPLAVIRRPAYIEEREKRAAARMASPEFRKVDLSDVKVLVVDDEPDAREFLERLLAECSATVMTAASAEEALSLVQREQPHVLVSDIGMPEGDGYELLRRVRALPPERGGRVPAIALTAFARSEDRTRALHAGFLVHVSKPVEPSELVATVASVAGRTGAR